MILAISPIGHNQTELAIGHYRVLFSYETPVALLDVPTGRYYTTDTYYSRTTTRHINSWLDGSNATTVTQDFLYSAVTV
jgi:hypothetical protein